MKCLSVTPPDDEDHNRAPGPQARKNSLSPEYRHQATEYAKDYLPRLLFRITGEANLELTDRLLAVKRGQGVRLTSLVSVTSGLVALDRLVGGRDFRELSADNLSAALASYAKDHSPSSVRQFAIQVKGLFTWLHGGKLPDDVRMALKRLPTIPPPSQRPITEAEFQAMLAESAKTMPRRKALMEQAALWLMWDSGLRVSEILCLKVGSVTFNPNGTARVELPAGVDGLKTGPRTIFIHDAAPALKAWIAFLPWPENPQGVLWPAYRGEGTMLLKALGMMTRNLAKRAGIQRNIHPHLFRHTCATRKAKLGWKESALRAHFGWGRTSTMPFHYVHLAEADLEEKVRADAVVDPLGARVREDPNAALRDAVVAAVLAAEDAKAKLRNR